MDEYGGVAAPPRPPKPARVHGGGGSGAAAGAGGVSLLRPRPEHEREPNAYVEAPRRLPARAPAPSPPPLKPVTSQPGARASAAKRPVSSHAAHPSESIVCAACGRCRCLQCARGRPLPERWVCGSCLCSAEACVDYASCMCCVKALLYHCGGEAEAQDSSRARSGCAAALAVALPCLLLYWPLRALAAAVAAVYARCHRAGCRCPRPPPRLPSII